MAEGGLEQFLRATSGALADREQMGLWARLTALRVKGVAPSWNVGCLVASVGSSVSWMSVAREKFPCVQPHKKYLVLQEGRAYIPSSALLLAVQGIQEKEVEAFDLNAESESRLQDFAGNMFTAKLHCLIRVSSCRLMLNNLFFV